MSEVHGGRDGKRTDYLLDHILFYQAKNSKLLKMLDMIEAATPSSKQVIDEIRKEINKKPIPIPHVVG